jgi:hypothetical protein
VDEDGDTKDGPDEIPHDATLHVKGLGGERGDMNTTTTATAKAKLLDRTNERREIPLGMNICFNFVYCHVFFALAPW